ncbi:MAG: hypothetical protein QGH48_03405 [Candidatus Poseidoniia archaeon]|nr:hypothetical protein [Candidatus Poseidoniia archaeon]
MNRSQFVSLILSFAFLGVLITWTPTTAEEVEDQEQDVSLYLYTYNGIGRLHTMETGGHGDADQVSIQPGSSTYFALNLSLQTDLPVKSYRTDVGFHLYLYANSADFNAGHLNLFVRDGTTMTGGELLASGDMNVPTVIQTNNEEHVDIYWEDDYGPTHSFASEHYIVLELENDGDNAINLELDSGKSGDSPSRLVTTTNPIRDITVLTESYNLATPDPEDLVSTENFKPNLPSDISKMFVSGTALNAFGTYDITKFEVSVFDSDGNELFVGETEVDEPDQDSDTNEFEEIIWNYNNPAEPSENHKGKGIYTVRVSAVNQQGNEFSLDKSIQMDAYGVYLYTAEPDQNVAVGGDVEYQVFVMNAGDEQDKFTIEPSETSDNWVVSPSTWTSSTLGSGDEQAVTFTISASDSTEMVGKSAVVIFTGQSENAVVEETFGLITTTSVGAEYEVSLYFEDEVSGQAVSSLSTKGVAGEWNQYTLSAANQGQATDGVQLIAQEVPPDWEIKFEYGDLNDGSITVEGIPRSGDGYNVANVTVWAKPAQGGDIETADIELIGISQGNTSKSDTATLSITRTFGLVLSVTPQGHSGIFTNKQAGEQFEVDLLLESAVEDERTIRLYIPDDELPDGWSYSFKENGATVTETTLDGGESKPLDIFITVGSQAVYNEEGYSFNAMAQDLSDSSVLARQGITVMLRLDSGFALTSLQYRIEGASPGESYTVQLNIDNQANGDDRFTLSASSVPSGWRVVFPDGNTFDVEAARSLTVPIQITVGDEAEDGDKVSIMISVASQLSNQEKQQSFVIEVEQGFTSRLSSALADLWYIFVFLGLVIVIGVVTYYRQEDDWDEDYSDDTESDQPPPEPDNEWDDWN